jgi:hypothetical protein
LGVHKVIPFQEIPRTSEVLKREDASSCIFFLAEIGEFMSSFFMGGVTADFRGAITQSLGTNLAAILNGEIELSL